MPRGKKATTPSKAKEPAVKEETPDEVNDLSTEEPLETDPVEEKEEQEEAKEEPQEENGIAMEQDTKKEMVKEEVKPKKELPKEEPKQNLMKGDTHVFFNMNNALKMVIIKPFKIEMFDDTQFVQWCKRAREVNFQVSPSGEGEAILYFSTIAKGDGAYLDLKTTTDDEIKVFHPSGTPHLNANKFWASLHESSSLARSPVNMNADDPDELFQRQIILEKVPETVSEEELVEKFPEAYNVICYPHSENFVGIRMLVFKDVESARNFKKENDDLEIDGEKVKASIYAERIKSWSDTYSRDQVKGVELTDDERIEKCQRIHELEEQKDGLINKEDLFGEEKILEYHVIQREIKPLIDEVKVDTNRRRMSGQRKFPEPDNIKSPYTKFAETKDFVKNKRFMRDSGRKRSHTGHDSGPSNKRYSNYGGSGGGGSGYQGSGRNWQGGMGSRMGGGMGSGGRMSGMGGGMGRMSGSMGGGMGGGMYGGMNRGGGNLNDLLQGLSNALSNSVAQMNRGGNMRGNRY